MKTVDLHRQATAEMIEAAPVYEQRREGLGFRFIRVFEESATRSATTPQDEPRGPQPAAETGSVLPDNLMD